MRQKCYFCCMRIDVIPYASAIRPDLIRDRTVVVIDVLRASSVMVTALANGARAFIPVETVEAAYEIVREGSGDEFILAGERDTQMIDGFHLGNSPMDYTPEKVKGKTIILTTSNGTKALNMLTAANKVMIGAFLNIDALVNRLMEDSEVVFVCSGTNNNFSMDDAMCAAAITDKLMQRKSIKMSDMALTLLKAYKSEEDNLRHLLRDSYHLNLLIRNGFEKDVDYCLQKNVYDIVPGMNKDRLINISERLPN